MTSKFELETLSDTSSLMSEKDRLSSQNEDGSDNSVLIANTNKLLLAVGIFTKKIDTVEELIRVAPSMFVAIFEALYQMRIEDVIRNPKTTAEYVRNAQLVIDHLSDQIGIDLTHINGSSIVEGDLDSLSNLVHIFVRIVSLASEQSISTIESQSIASSSTSSIGSTLNEAAPIQTSNKTLKVVAQAIDRARKLQGLHDQQYAAEKRRKAVLDGKSATVRLRNVQHQHTAEKIKEKKSLSESLNKRKSHDLKMRHQDETLLNKFYRRLFEAAKSARRDMEKQEKEVEKSIHTTLSSKVEELESRFKKQMELLREEKAHAQRLDLPSCAELVNHLREYYDNEYAKLSSSTDQLRARKMLKRKEALLSLLPSTDWESDLRQSRSSNK